MPDLTGEIYPLLRERKMTLKKEAEKWIYPDYGGGSIANLPASILNWLDVPFEGAPRLREQITAWLDRQYRHVILIVVDGLGFKMFQRFVQEGGMNKTGPGFWKSILSESLLTPLTSVVPSTTATAITTLWTGRFPSEHGILGYEIWLKEYGMIVNMVTQSPVSYVGEVGALKRVGFTPETFLPVPTIGPRLNQSGIRVNAFLNNSIARSGLSTMHLPGARVFPYSSIVDLWSTLVEVIEAGQLQKSYTSVYWGEIDELSHRYGPDNGRVVLEFDAFSHLMGYFITRLQKAFKGQGLLLVTADHGEKSTPKQGKFEIRQHPDLLANLTMLPSGESRLAYLYARPGTEEKIQHYVEQAWPGEFYLIKGKEFIKSGMFGIGTQPHPGLEDRIGDWILASREDAYWWWASKENHLLGRHGGLTEEEMVVPLVAIPL